ncbi:MAG: RlmE family RNA methyltransferase [Spirochaetales bacterium]|nr:RlmE family RNA methyltransferase [Spirochaetales bacterium]
MKHTSDHYAKKARDEGYPARSVYKLEEMQAKYRIVKKGDRVLDIGSAPGSWSLFALKQAGPGGRVVGVDPAEMKLDSRNTAAFRFICGDIFSEEVAETISGMGPYTAVLSDAAPSTTGDRIVDTARSYELAARVFELAVTVLDEGGNLVIKIFQGGDERTLYRRMEDEFSRVKAFKPRASKKASMEIYYIGIGFMGKNDRCRPGWD